MMRKKKPTTGALIDAARRKAGLSVSALAREIGCSQPYLREVIRGEATPVETAQKRMDNVTAFLLAIAGATGTGVSRLRGDP